MKVELYTHCREHICKWGFGVGFTCQEWKEDEVTYKTEVYTGYYIDIEFYKRSFSIGLEFYKNR